MRVNGTEGVKLIECINPAKDKWRIRWDIQNNVPTESNPNASGVNYEEFEFSCKPSIDEVKEVIIDWYNGRIDNAILKDFLWKEMPVWLSMENQFNYKAAFDMAALTAGKSLPVTFKFGTNEKPVYYEFTTLEDITDFYTKAVAFKDRVLSEGWALKDAIDFSQYEC